MPSTPHRFQFSLRTLFVVVTLLAIPCAYVAQQAKMVRERQVVLKEVRQIGGEVWPKLEYGPDEGGNERSPIVRHWLGDQLIAVFWFPCDTSPDEIERVMRIFPESAIRICSPPAE